MTKAPPTTAHKKSRIFYGWWIVSAGFSIQFLIGSLYMHSFTAFFPFLESQFGWSRTILSGAFAFSRAESGLLGPLQGWMIEKFGTRAMGGLGMAIYGIGFIIFSQVNSIFGYYTAFFIMAAGSSIAGHLTVSTAAINWFIRRRGIAMGIMNTGFAIGGLVVPIVALSLISLGWRTTALCSGFLIICIGIPISGILRNEPEQYGYAPDGDEPANPDDGLSGPTNDSKSHLIGFTVREAMRTRSFWLLNFGHAVSLMTVGAVSLHLVPHIIDTLGLSVTTASSAVAIVTISNMVGLLSGGFLGDRYSKRYIAAIAALMHAVALIILANATSLTQVYAFAILHGTAWGLRGPIMSTIRADYFGRAYFPTIMGFSSLVVMIGMTFGPLFAGIMSDIFGNYRIGFMVIAGLAALGGAFFAASTQPKLPKRLSDINADIR
ncbi:MAG: hypothetical protein CL787_02325 [Chloroflexi bacterium]|nr:hypothetical protein [Chloroflexota bacterium]